MDEQSRRIVGLFARYFLLAIAGLGNLYIFYKVLTPLTIISVDAILSLFTKTIVYGNSILVNKVVIAIVPACVAGAAFYLLFILVFSTADIKPKKRFFAILLATLILFTLNILRIVFLALIVDNIYFPLIHWILWYLASTIFVVAIWFSIVKIYKIKSIPVYSDIKYLSTLIKPGKKSKRSKKN